MDIRPLHTEEDYRAALAEVSALVHLDPEAGTPSGDRLEVLSILVERYEAGHRSHYSQKNKLVDLLAQCDPSAPYAGEVWSDVAPVGREFGAHTSDAPMPRERLQGTVRRYDDPTDPVWPLNDDDEAVTRAANDNPDLPRSFVADTLQGLAEVRNRHTKPLAQQSKIDDTEQPPPETSWNYRVMEFTEGEERWQAIHEVHYHRGVPTSYSTQPATLHWDPKDDSDAGDRTLGRMREALGKPVLRASDFA